MIKNWYCYVCGKTLGKEYNLVSLNESTDRVFLTCDDCIDSIDMNPIIVKVKERI